MSTDHVYRVTVTCEGDAWLADVAELDGAHTYARTLPALDRAVREIVVMAVDRPEEDMPALRLTYDYHTGDPDIDVTAILGISPQRVSQLTGTTKVS